MTAQIIDLEDFKQGKYIKRNKNKKETMTIEDCIKELDAMYSNATPRQQTALGVGINLMIEYLTGGDDGK